jgi:dihydroorotate dehydrogenase
MNLYKLFRPLVFKLDPEKAHDLALNFLQFTPNLATLFALNRNYNNLRTKVWNLGFTSPIGMAAGFDKNARAFATLSKFGFGFVEVGTVTPKPQSGNEKPRLFRLVEDRAIINRLGFNNLGAEVLEKNLAHNIINFDGILGVNIGKNKETENALDDYLPLLERFYKKADYITINISSPNTKNLRDLQKEDQLDLFLSEIMKKKNALKILHKEETPILLKVAPDLTVAEQRAIAAVALKNQIDGLIISNTTIDRPELKSAFAGENGGLSGKPLFEKSNEVLKNFYRFTAGKIPLIAVGGVSNAADAYEKIKCGASLVQIYSAFIYEGFALVDEIKKDLSEMVEKDGFKNIVEAVGSKLR